MTITAKEATKNYNKRCPWAKKYSAAKTRCNNHKSESYQKYGGIGIKMLMTMDDFKRLWIRDKAHLMKKPSIHRIDSAGNYEYSNCMFIEQSINSSMKNTSLLTFKKAEEIRSLIKDGYTYTELAKKFKVSNYIIGFVNRGLTYTKSTHREYQRPSRRKGREEK